MITWELSFCNTKACSLNDEMVDWVDDLSEIIREGLHQKHFFFIKHARHFMFGVKDTWVE